MYLKIICLLTGLTGFALNYKLPVLQELVKARVPLQTKILKSSLPQITLAKATGNRILTNPAFRQLPGWNKADVRKSLEAFRVSCKTFLKQEATQPVGSRHINLKAGDWHPACKAALLLPSFSEVIAKTFFEKWFQPLRIEPKKPVQGLFTGYYMPGMKGSLTKTKQYKTPIYGLPRTRVKRLSRFTRKAIDNGALKKKHR